MHGDAAGERNVTMNCPPHHWLLAPPEAQESVGRCKKCRATKTFPMTTYGRYWDTPAILRDPLPRRTDIGDFGLPNYY